MSLRMLSKELVVAEVIPPPVWMEEQVLAARWNVSIFTVQRMRKRRELRAKRIGGRWKYREDWVREYEDQEDTPCLRTSGSGNGFLGKRPNSPNWCVCWFDPATRQTQRSSLRTADFQVAKIRLAEHVTKYGTMKNVDADGVPLEAILIRLLGGIWQGYSER
jgi:hypothetical protein